jgi:hypothetical protein
MDEFSPMVEVIGIRWHCARPETSHKSASNQLQILRTHCPKNGRLRLVKRSKSNCRKKQEIHTLIKIFCTVRISRFVKATAKGGD